MDNIAGNAIQKARICSGLTQEALAERIGYSPDSVRAWEGNTRTASAEALDLMAQVLDAPWLPAEYMRERIRSLDAMLPRFVIGKPLTQAVAGFIVAMLDLSDAKVAHNLLRMVADGGIDVSEKDEFAQLMFLAEKAVKAFYEVKYAREE